MGYGFWIAAALLGVAAASVWTAFRNPAFIAGLVKIAVDHVLPTLLRRLPPEREAEWRDRQKTGEKDDRR